MERKQRKKYTHDNPQDELKYNPGFYQTPVEQIVNERESWNTFLGTNNHQLSPGNWVGSYVSRRISEQTKNEETRAMQNYRRVLRGR